MNNFNYKSYAADLHVASSRASPYAAAVALGWLAFPFVLQTVLHPTDAIWLQLKLQGFPVHRFTAQDAGSGLVISIFALVCLVLAQMIWTVLFYRRANMQGASVATPALWPMAALFGLIGNGVWWWWTGYFDPNGGLVGWSSAALTLAAELVCNKLGRKFVLGSAQKAAVPFFG